ncbi:unnamed protein product, partial [Cyprideis torosa]
MASAAAIGRLFPTNLVMLCHSVPLRSMSTWRSYSLRKIRHFGDSSSTGYLYFSTSPAPPPDLQRLMKQQQENLQKQRREKIRSTVNYVIAAGLAALGLSFAAVPLYRVFCQTFSYGGTVVDDIKGKSVAGMKPVNNRLIRISFRADTAGGIRWKFQPQQSEVH